MVLVHSIHFTPVARVQISRSECLLDAILAHFRTIYGKTVNGHSYQLIYRVIMNPAVSATYRQLVVVVGAVRGVVTVTLIETFGFDGIFFLDVVGIEKWHAVYGEANCSHGKAAWLFGVRQGLGNVPRVLMGSGGAVVPGSLILRKAIGRHLVVL